MTTILLSSSGIVLAEGSADEIDCALKALIAYGIDQAELSVATIAKEMI